MALKDVGVKLIVEGSPQFKAAMTGAERSVKGVQGAVNKAAPAMKKFGFALIGMAAAVGGASLKMAMDFDSAMREVNSLIGLGAEQFNTFSAEVLDLSSALGVDAVKATQALYQAISAGIPAENALKFLEIASKAAIGGVTDTETAVDGLTTVINAFGMNVDDAQKVADIMFQTVKGGKTTFDELSRSMFQVAPIAAASGVAFDEVSAALATMTKQGVPTSVATTQLRQAIVAIQKPTKEMQAAIEAVGYETGQAMLASLGFADTLEGLREVTAGNNEELFKMFGSIEAGQAVLALTGDNARTFADDLAAVKAATDGVGAATEAYEIINEGAARQFEILTTRLKNVGIEIGLALMPALIEFLDVMRPVLENIANWIKANKDLIPTILGAMVKVGGLLVVLGFLPKIIGAVKIGLVALGVAFKAIIAIATFLATTTFGLIILAIIAVGLAIKALAENWSVIWRGIKRRVVSIVNSIILVINHLIRALNRIPGVNIGEIALLPEAARSGLSEHTKKLIAEQQRARAEIAKQAIPAWEGVEAWGARVHRVIIPAGSIGPQLSPVNQTTYNVEANYTGYQDPATIALDLEALALQAGR